MKKFLVCGGLGIALLLGLNEFLEQVEILKASLSPKTVQARSGASVAPKPVFLPAPRPLPGNWEGLAQSASHNPVLEIAERYLSEHKNEWNLQSYHELRPKVFEGPLFSRVTYQVYQDNMPIIGMRIVIQIDRNNAVSALENQYAPLKKVDLSELDLMPGTEVLSSARDRFRISAATSEGDHPTMALYYAANRESALPVYLMTVSDPSHGGPAQAMFRATDGQLLHIQYSRKEF